MIYARKTRKTGIKHSNESNTHIYHLKQTQNRASESSKQSL